MVKGFHLIEKPTSMCEDCILRKEHRESFPTGMSIRAKRPLEINHLDLCGPMKIPSIGGSNYFLKFIDDYSRKIWVFFLKYKDGMFVYFCQFKALVKKKSGHYIKALGIDRGCEYISNELLNFFKENGFQKQFATRYIPLNKIE